MNTGPRPHYYHFAHRLLPHLAQSNAAAFCGAMFSPDREKILAKLWEDLGSNLPLDHRLPTPSISVTPSRIGMHLLILFAFPQPLGRTEAHFSAFLAGPLTSTNPDELNSAPQKYYVLEHGFSLEGSPRTVFAEWSSDGSHLNYGTGPPPTAEAFIARIKQLENLKEG